MQTIKTSYFYDSSSPKKIDNRDNKTGQKPNPNFRILLARPQDATIKQIMHLNHFIY